MKKHSFANILSFRVMLVLIVMMAILMVTVHDVTKDTMALEAGSRYESIILNSNERIRGVLSDVYVGAINNINDIERDIDDPDKLQAHLERMVKLNMYMSYSNLTSSHRRAITSRSRPGATRRAPSGANR